MTPEMQLIFEKYVTIRFPNGCDIYRGKWNTRFREGMEWQLSDYEGRRILKEIAPEIYPDDKDEYFVREV